MRRKHDWSGPGTDLHHTQPVQPRTLTSVLVRRLHRDIISCQLEPGERLKLGELSRRYDAGVIPLREALSRLAAIGLVEVEDQKGFSVSAVSLEDLQDITQTRIYLECIALRGAIEYGDLEWETRVIAAHHRLARLSQTDATPPHALGNQWEHVHREFHVALLAGCGSTWLLHFQKVLADQSTRYRRLAVALRSWVRDVRGEHERIVEAVLARDVELACARLKAHYEMTADAVRAHARGRFQRRKGMLRLRSPGAQPSSLG